MRRRRGFTIVELLVAMALIMFIMALLSQAFIIASASFRKLKGLGDLAERLRSAGNLIRADISGYYCYNSKGNQIFLSDPAFWGTAPAFSPPAGGFLRVYNGSPSSQAPNLSEGPNLDSVQSFVFTNHALHFTVKLPLTHMPFAAPYPQGFNRTDFFSATILPGSSLAGMSYDRYQDGVDPATGLPNQFTSNMAEVAYFLVATNPQDFADGTTPLFSLYRHQRLFAIPPAGGPLGITGGLAISSTNEVSVNPTTSTLNSPASLTVPPYRFGMDYSSLISIPAPPAVPTPSASYPGVFAAGNNYPAFSQDLILTDVISFSVRLLVNGSGTNDFLDLFQLTQSGGLFNNNNSQFNNSTGPLVFDTWTNLSPPNDLAVDYSQWNATGSGLDRIPIFKDNTPNQTPIRILAIQVIIRAWDERTSQTRQISIIQSL